MLGDEGISIPETDTLIEVDFLFGSRMQESQRIGRLLHSGKEATNHFIPMTEQELEKYRNGYLPSTRKDIGLTL